MPERREISVDQTTPEFRAALEREIERLEAEGVRVRDVVARAKRNVVAAFKKVEEARRLELLGPLVDAMSDFERSRGCWAYTVTAKYRGTVDDRPIEAVQIMSIDPSEPVETAWTLVSVNGVAPDEQPLADWRRRNLRHWEKQLRTIDRKSIPEHVWSRTSKARWIEFEVDVTNSDHPKYIFETAKANVPLVFRFSGLREEYVVDHVTGKLRSRRQTSLGPLVAFTTRVDQADIRTEYATVDPNLPPFHAKDRMDIQARMRGRHYDLVIERVYSNYRRVTCYDERFQVEMPELEMLEFLPGFN